MKTITNEATAKSLAREWHEDHFEERSCTVDLENGTLALIDNNPMSGEAMEARVPLMKAAVTAAGGTVLSVSAYPETGPSAGYTVAVLLEGADDEELFRQYAEKVHARPAPTARAPR